MAQLLAEAAWALAMNSSDAKQVEGRDALAVDGAWVRQMLHCILVEPTCLLLQQELGWS